MSTLELSKDNVGAIRVALAAFKQMLRAQVDAARNQEEHEAWFSALSSVEATVRRVDEQSSGLPLGEPWINFLRMPNTEELPLKY